MRLIELGEAMRMVKNSREDCPETSIKGRAIWETAHNCALSCLTNCSTIDPESLRPKGEWISVEDRLPEVGRSVIAFNAHAKCAAEAVYKGDGKFLQFRWAARLQEQEVTHWMPLPEPPCADMKGAAHDR